MLIEVGGTESAVARGWCEEKPFWITGHKALLKLLSRSFSLLSLYTIVHIEPVCSFPKTNTCILHVEQKKIIFYDYRLTDANSETRKVRFVYVHKSENCFSLKEKTVYLDCFTHSLAWLTFHTTTVVPAHAGSSR